MALTEQDLRSIGDLMENKIDDLKTLTQKEFARVNDRFNEVDKRFNEVDKRFDEVDNRFSYIENKIDSNHSAMTSEFLKIHNKIDLVNKRTFEDEEAMAGDIVGLQKRVTKLEKIKTA